MAEKFFVLITGMYKSGTSLVARALNSAGLYMGKLENINFTHLNHYYFNNNKNYQANSEKNSNNIGIKSNPTLLAGSWENNKLLQLAEKTLPSYYSTFDQDIVSAASSVQVIQEEQQQQKVIVDEQIGKEIRNYTEELMSHPSLAAGFNDPRILLYLESWLEYLPKNIVMVGTFRHPFKVAESLKVTNQFSYDKSINLWKLYNHNLLSVLEKHGGFLLNLDWPKDRLFTEMQLIAKRLGLVYENITDTLENLFSEEEEDLVHHHSNNDATINDKINDVEMTAIYSKLHKRAENNSKFGIKDKQQNHHILTHTKEEQWEIIRALLSDMQKQCMYYEKIREELALTRWRLRFESIEKQKIIEEHGAEFRSLKEKDAEIKKLVNDVLILQNMNLQHEETKGIMDAEIKKLVNDVSVLQKTNVEHQKTIEFQQMITEQKENQIKQLNELLKTTIEQKENQIKQLNESLGILIKNT